MLLLLVVLFLVEANVVRSSFALVVGCRMIFVLYQLTVVSLDELARRFAEKRCDGCYGTARYTVASNVGHNRIAQLTRVTHFGIFDNKHSETRVLLWRQS